MNQQDKQLLLTDLCGRLPYGVKFKYFDAYDHEKDRVGIVNEIDIKADCFCDEAGSRYKFGKTAVPILFPLSCLTQEITIAGETFVPIVELARAGESQFFSEEGLNIKSVKDLYGCGWLSKDGVAFSFSWFGDHKSFFLCNENGDRLCFSNQPGLFDLINSWHIDYRGLIDKGLAVSVYSLDKNPYE